MWDRRVVEKHGEYVSEYASISHTIFFFLQFYSAPNCMNIEKCLKITLNGCLWAEY